MEDKDVRGALPDGRYRVKGIEKELSRFAEETQGRMELGEPTDLVRSLKRYPWLWQLGKGFEHHVELTLQNKVKPKERPPAPASLLGTTLSRMGRTTFFSFWC